MRTHLKTIERLAAASLVMPLAWTLQRWGLAPDAASPFAIGLATGLCLAILRNAATYGEVRQ